GSARRPGKHRLRRVRRGAARAPPAAAGPRALSSDWARAAPLSSTGTVRRAAAWPPRAAAAPRSLSADRSRAAPVTSKGHGGRRITTVSFNHAPDPADRCFRSSIAISAATSSGASSYPLERDGDSAGCPIHGDLLLPDLRI